MKEEIKLIIDNNTLIEYEKYYFKHHPRASKKPISNPYHESINTNAGAKGERDYASD